MEHFGKKYVGRDRHSLSWTQHPNVYIIFYISTISLHKFLTVQPFSTYWNITEYLWSPLNWLTRNRLFFSCCYSLRAAEWQSIWGNKKTQEFWSSLGEHANTFCEQQLLASDTTQDKTTHTAMLLSNHHFGIWGNLQHTHVHISCCNYECE